MSRIATLTEWDEAVNGPIGNKIRKGWDFPESDVHYVSVTAKDKKRYKVHKSGTEDDRKRAANVLAEYQATMEKIIKNMKTKTRLSELQKHQRKLFLSIHDKYGHKVQEMNRTYVKFSGMNKPYNIILDRDAYPIGPKITSARDLNGSAVKEDRKDCTGYAIPYLRPSSRTVFLDARNGYKEWLIVHELAHTVANHVVFRPDDHYSDFKAAEKFVESCL